MARFRAAESGVCRLICTQRIRLVNVVALFATYAQLSFAADQKISTDTLAMRGDERAARGDIKGAVEDYGRAIKEDDRCVKAYLGRGLLRARFGQFDAAIEDYSKAIKLKPHMREAFFARAMSLGRLPPSSRTRFTQSRRTVYVGSSVGEKGEFRRGI